MGSPYIPFSPERPGPFGPAFVDLTGKEFGDHITKLTVVKAVGWDKFGRVAWLCRCSCGQETVVSSTGLRRHVTAPGPRQLGVRSCGCRLGTKLITFRGETLPRSKWAKRLGISPQRLVKRLEVWPFEIAMTAGPQKSHAVSSR